MVTDCGKLECNTPVLCGRHGHCVGEMSKHASPDGRVIMHQESARRQVFLVPEQGSMRAGNDLSESEMRNALYLMFADAKDYLEPGP